jgi:hypothetical protein
VSGAGGGGSEEDKDRQVLGDIVEAVILASRDEECSSRADLGGAPAGREGAVPAHHEVDLVLGVRRLVVGRAGRE